MENGTTEPTIPIRVECYAGYRGEETPRVILMGGERIAVAMVVDQWLAPDHRYFKVQDTAGDLFIVRHDVNADRWELIMYQRGTVRPN